MSKAAKGSEAVSKQGDEKAWSDFVTWCRKRGLNPMPANPWTVAAYARWCERHHRYPVIVRTIRAVARVHRTKSRQRPDRHPTVARTLRLIEIRARARGRVKGKGVRLFPEDDLTGTDAGDSAPEGKAPAKAATKAAKKSDAKARGPQRRGLRAAPKLVAKRNLAK